MCISSCVRGSIFGMKIGRQNKFNRNMKRAWQVWLPPITPHFIFRFRWGGGVFCFLCSPSVHLWMKCFLYFKRLNFRHGKYFSVHIISYTFPLKYSFTFKCICVILIPHHSHLRIHHKKAHNFDKYTTIIYLAWNSIYLKILILAFALIFKDQNLFIGKLERT